jgi:ribosome recycling factor
MTLEEIKIRVNQIRSNAYDDEKAHSMEDELREDFIKFISREDSPFADMAKQILKTSKIDFCRW